MKSNDIIAGCEKCSSAAYSGMAFPLRAVGEVQGQVFLYRCELCGTYWQESMRSARAISESEALSLCAELSKSNEACAGTPENRLSV